VIIKLCRGVAVASLFLTFFYNAAEQFANKPTQKRIFLGKCKLIKFSGFSELFVIYRMYQIINIDTTHKATIIFLILSIIIIAIVIKTLSYR